MKSMLVICLGRFGSHLAIRLSQLGNEVMAVDRSEDAVMAISSEVTACQIGDCTDEKLLQSLGPGNYDCCFVCMGEDFQSSLEITSLLKELGAKLVVAKAERVIHVKFLMKIGADEVICPERDMAYRAALRYTADNAFQCIELTSDCAIMELEVPESWIGRSLAELDIRARCGVNIIGVLEGTGVKPLTDPNFRFSAGQHFYAAGGKKELIRLSEK